MAKKFENPTLNGKTKTNAIHPVAFINQPLAAPHQAFWPIGSEVPLAKKIQLPPGGSQGEVAGAGTIQFTYLFREQRGAKSPYHLQIVYSCNRPVAS